MRIAIMGAGGIGAFYGACLARAGNDVIFIARGAHLDAMRKNGLKIENKGDPDFTINTVNATDDPSNVGAVDAILFCVKMYDAIDAAKLCKLMMGENTIVVTLQNGVESVSIVNSVLGEGLTLGGAAYVAATIMDPGLIKRNNLISKIEFGEADGSFSQRATALADVLNESGIEAIVTSNTQSMLWSKFALMTSTSCITSLCRMSTSVLQTDPVAREVYGNAMRECVAVGRALGVEIPENVFEKIMHITDNSPPLMSSMANDLIAGRRLELEWLSGAIHRLGQGASIATPIHSPVYAALRPHVNGAV